MEEVPSTFFAPARRASDDEVHAAAVALEANPLTAALMQISGRIVAILNPERQVLSVKEGLLKFLGVTEVNALVGLRPGEALRCVHSKDHPGGCGTGRVCSDCGAAIAIVLAQNTGQPVDRDCRLVIDPGGPRTIDLLVRASPFDFGGQRLVVLVLHENEVMDPSQFQTTG
jgi:hypothetical protein